MASILSANTDKIEDLKSELVISIELQRGEGCDLSGLGHFAARMIEAAQPLTTPPTGTVDSPPESRLRAVEVAYESWKTLDTVLQDTLSMAYAGTVPPSNLQLDQLRASLRESVGDPLAASYSALRATWRDHVGDRPWDAFKGDAPAHVDGAQLESAMSALVRGDDLDVEDAMMSLTGRLRYAFAEHIATNPDDVRDLEIGLWKRPEIIIAGDYWGRGRGGRLIDMLIERGSRRFADALRTLDRFFTPSTMNAATIVGELRSIPDVYRERFTRCLMLHPDSEVRRYAVTNADVNSIWKVVSPDTVPCATILSLLEHMTGSATPVSQRKIFFDTIYRRLLTVTSRSDVLYSRGIARILSRMDFFVEDEYFVRLSRVLDYLAVKEKLHGIDDELMSTYVGRLRREKERVGSRASEEPSFAGVPLVILRKLARDGHFWYLLSMHPIVKIARETIAWIHTPDRAYRVAGNQRVNQEVIRAIGRRRDLFTRLSSRMALLANPKTPPTISVDYLPELTQQDIETLLRRSGLHPELRTLLRNRLNERTKD